MNESAATQAAVSHLPPKVARMAAIEILLADPSALGDDVLEAESQLRNHSGTWRVAEMPRDQSRESPCCQTHLRPAVRAPEAEQPPAPSVWALARARNRGGSNHGPFGITVSISVNMTRQGRSCAI